VLLALIALLLTKNPDYTVDLTTYTGGETADLGMGTALSVDGQRITADRQCLYLDGKPWLPACGEFQFSRYPRAEWKEELLKMRACGLDVVGTYVFWNHIEEQRGVIDWSGPRSLHDFLSLCKEVGLKALVRMGPWCHGETRNGGFPDWIEADSKAKRFKLRSTDPAYLSLVAPYYKSMADQMKGLLWKDGGPVIGIQLDNECSDLDYLQALKKMAQDYGVDVPLYTVTGWSVPVPRSGLIPMFGRYGDAFWMDAGDPEIDKSYIIDGCRDDNDMGEVNGQIGDLRPDRSKQLAGYPHMCIETGGGMQSIYTRRIFMYPDDTGALALCRVAAGANFLGYYIFQGAVTPDGKFSSLNETPSTGYFDVPIKDYDFNAPLSNCGRERDSYGLLKEIHLFLNAFGNRLAPMPAYFPLAQPKDTKDVESLRWSVRSDGKSGFLFFNNHERTRTMPAKSQVQFHLKTLDGTMDLPQTPVTIPADSYGIWPINLDCNGVLLTYATAQPITMLTVGGSDYWFFKAIAGIAPEFQFGGETVTGFNPGPGVAFTRTSHSGRSVCFVVLPPAQSAELWKMPFRGEDRVWLSHDALMLDGANRLVLQSFGFEPRAPEVFPSIGKGVGHGVFTRLGPNAPDRERAMQLHIVEAKYATPDHNPKTNATDESAWRQAAVYNLPYLSGDRLLRIRYQGDVARIYCAGRLVMDNFYNGEPFDFGLWRIPLKDRDKLVLKIMPLRRADRGRFPKEAVAKLPDQESVAELLGVVALDKVERVVTDKGRQ
jgi:hypothetical protein